MLTKRRSLVVALLAVAAAGWWIATRGRAHDPADEPRRERPEPANDAKVATAPAVARESAPVAAEPRPVDEAGATVASHTAAATEPGVTFERHLIAVIEKECADDRLPPTSSTRSVDQAVADRSLNPDAKMLDAQRTEQLAALVREFAASDEAFAKEERRLSREALIASVENGRFVAKVQAPLSVPTNAQEAAAFKDEQARRFDEHRKVMEDLSRQLGPPADWGYSQLSSITPQGIAYTTVVYYTSAQSPALFESRRRRAEPRRTFQSAAREIFAGSPK